MPHLPAVGDLFGRYRIEALIGSGGMGAVYLATDPRLGRRVALKLVSRAGDPAGAEEFVRRFEREAGVLAKLDSRHVIAVYDYGEEDGQPFIVTQYVAGGDLGHLVHAQGPLRPATAARICAQVAGALADAHTAGVVHRDVKPANVLVRDPAAAEPEVLLCDFGVARTHSDGLTTPGSVTGTWAYLAPECGRGQPASPASDLYSLGCVLWTCLTGAPPYDGSDVEIAIAHQQQPVPQLPPTSPAADALNHVLARMLAKDPTDRYPDASACRRDLERLATTLGDRPSLSSAAAAYVREGETAVRAGRSRRRHTIIAGAVALAVVAAGAALAVTRPWSDDSPGAHKSGPVTGDIDGDGRGDVVLVGSSGKTQDVDVWSSRTKALTKPVRLAGDDQSLIARYADVDGDGRPELVTLTAGKTRVTATASLTGGGRLDSAVPLPATYPPLLYFDALEPRFGDVDGDGDSDIVLRSWELENRPQSYSGYWTQTGSAHGWAAPRKAFPLDTPNTLNVLEAVGDLDGDGKDDLAIVTQPYSYTNASEKAMKTSGGRLAATLTVYRSTGTTLVEAGSRKLSEYPLQAVEAADVDGDGSDEIVLATRTPEDSDRLRVVTVTDGKPGAPVDGPTIPGTSGDFGSGTYTVSDLDGDGTDDIVHATERSDGRLRLRACYSDGRRLGAPRDLALVPATKALSDPDLQPSTW